MSESTKPRSMMDAERFLDRSPIRERSEMLLMIEVINGNPNGDPENGNQPRQDPYTGRVMMTDSCIKRPWRDWLHDMAKYIFDHAATLMLFRIFVQRNRNTNTFIAEAHEEANGGVPGALAQAADGENGSSTKDYSKIKGNTDQTAKAQEHILKSYSDARTFGGVFSCGPNAGQVQGPVQMNMPFSVGPAQVMNHSITRVARTESLKGLVGTKDQYVDWEKEQPQDYLRTMGSKSTVHHALFLAKIFVNPHRAQQVGFAKGDFNLLVAGLLRSWEHVKSSGRSEVNIRGLFQFKHVGMDGNEEQRARQAMLGCAPSHHTLDRIVQVRMKDSVVQYPSSMDDYEITIDRNNIPNGVEVIDLYKEEWGVAGCEVIDVTEGREAALAR